MKLEEIVVQPSMGQPGNDVSRTSERSTVGDEISLVAMVLEHQAKEVVAQPEVYRQFPSYLPVVVEKTTVVVLAVVRERRCWKYTRRLHLRRSRLL